MRTSRRRFVRETTLVSSAIALGSALPAVSGQTSGQTSGQISGQADGQTSGQTSAQTSNQADAHIQVFPAEPIATIEDDVYGHFIEHLGGVIYDGVWVGENSKIANLHGIRTAFLDTMREIKAPVLRWPGGCFADSYDWRDGIGPRATRPQRAAFWSQQDTNAYGLHEFMTTCKAIGCEPYVAADLRTLPARDFYQLVEYCNAPSTADAETGGVNALAAQRARNGDAAPFNVRYWGVGNETWGCGGSQTPDEYGGLYRRFTEWIPKFGPERLRLIACGANGDDARWPAAVMKSIGMNHAPFGFSTHYYTSGDARKFAAGDALLFNESEYYDLLARAALMDRVITDSWSAIGETDRAHRVKLVMDEWGAWYGKGTELAGGGTTGHYNLSQQSTVRDALLTAITFDIFHKHADKMAMANVAQTINCIHSLMLAEGDQFTRTPTFHVFRMYLPHRGAQSLRVEFAAPAIANTIAQVTPAGGNSAVGSVAPAARLAGLSGSASMQGRTVTLTVVNPHLSHALTTEIAVAGASVMAARGTVLSEPDVHAHNDFAHPNAVMPKDARVPDPVRGRLVHVFPPASVTALTITLL